MLEVTKFVNSIVYL